MPTTYFSYSWIVSAEAVSRCSLPDELEQLWAGTVASMCTGSDNNWLMSSIGGASSMLGQSSLTWLSMENRTAVQERNTHHWWHVAVLDAQQIEDSLRDITAVFRLAETEPAKFHVSADDFHSALDLDSRKDVADFGIPDEGDVGQYAYVLHALFALRRLLAHAIAQRKPIVHLMCRP